MYQPIINQLNTYISGEITLRKGTVYEWYFCIDILDSNSEPGDELYEAYCITRQQIQEVFPESEITDYWQNNDSIGFVLTLPSEN